LAAEIGNLPQRRNMMTAGRCSTLYSDISTRSHRMRVSGLTQWCRRNRLRHRLWLLSPSCRDV